MSHPTTAADIVVPLDGSPFAEAALPLACSIARATNRRLRLVHVHLLPLWPDELAGPDTVAAARRILHAEGESYLREVQRRIETTDLVVEFLVLPGDIVSAGEALSLHIQQYGASLIVMATHGRGGLRRFWLGSVADYLLRHLTVPVLVVRPGMEANPTGQRILVPLDGSVLAEQVLDDACNLARATQQEIVLLRIVHPIMLTLTGMEAPHVGIDSDLTAQVRAEADDYLDDIEAQVRAKGLKCLGMTMVGPSAAECIIDLGRPANFSLILMATHGYGGMRRMMLGSVADKVVRGADLPVMVLRSWTTPKPWSVPARMKRLSSSLPSRHGCADEHSGHDQATAPPEPSSFSRSLT